MKKVGFILLSILFLWSVYVSADSDVHTERQMDNRQVNVTKSWLKFESYISQLINQYVQEREADALSIIERANVSEVCSSTLIKYMKDLKSLEKDAVKIADSTGSWPNGLISGNLYSYGTYDQCLSIDTSQYCVMQVGMPLPKARKYEGYSRKVDPMLFPFKTPIFQEMVEKIHFLRLTNFSYGICLPRGCVIEELESLAMATAYHYDYGGPIGVRNCDQKIYPSLNAKGYGAVLTILVVIALNLAGTYGNYRCLSIFNMSDNYHSLTCVTSGKILSCLDGIKVISMFMIICSHTFGAQTEMHTYRLFKIEEVLSDPALFLSNLFPFNVDTFFTVTGIKTMQYIIKQGNKSPKWLVFVVSRYLGFLPLIGWALAINFILMSDLIQASLRGPNWWVLKGFNQKVCEKNWIQNLFLVQSWLDWGPNLRSCLMTDWYLSCDIVFAFLTIVIWIPIAKGKIRSALFCCWAMIIFGIVASGLTLWFFDLRAFWRIKDFLDTDALVYNNIFHLKPVSHLSSYFIGILSGYYIISSGKQSKKMRIFCWAFWVLILVTKFFFFYYDSETELYEHFLLAYGTFSKSLWSLVIAWLIFCIEKGHIPSFFDDFLSRPFMQILSRLSLSLMCLNLVIFRFKNAISLIPNESTPFKYVVLEYMPYIILVYLLAFVSTIMVGYPTANFMKSVFGGTGMPKRTKKPMTGDHESSELKVISIVDVDTKNNE